MSPAAVDPHGCVICAKHRGAGPLRGELVTRSGGFRIYHAPPGEDGRAPLGYLFIETERHAAHLDDLTEEEAATLGQLRSRTARALRAATQATHVIALVFGRHIPHFHEHLLVRYPGMPEDAPWYETDNYAPRADEEDVRHLADRIRKAFD